MSGHPITPTSDSDGNCLLKQLLRKHGRDCRWCLRYWAGVYAKEEEKCPYKKPDSACK